MWKVIKQVYNRILKAAPTLYKNIIKLQIRYSINQCCHRIKFTRLIELKFTKENIIILCIQYNEVQIQMFEKNGSSIEPHGVSRFSW